MNRVKFMYEISSQYLSDPWIALEEGYVQRLHASP